MKRMILAIAIITGLVSCKKQQIEEAPPPAPLEVISADGVSVKAYDFDKLQYFLKRKNDTTYVVNFWATWCIPCVEELPNFEKLGANYKDKKLKVVLVSLDMYNHVKDKLLPFVKKKQLKSEVLYLHDTDSNSWIPKVDSTWSGAIPCTVIYNSSKRSFFERSFTYDELEKEVNKFQ